MGFHEALIGIQAPTMHLVYLNLPLVSWKEGMQKNMQPIIMGYIGLLWIHSFIAGYCSQRHLKP